jgi:hypothetical protein
MHKPTAVDTLLAAIGCAVLVAADIAHAQIGGALQYPPPSVGQDAQPPPPARMVPQVVSPRRIELGVSGSSQIPAHHPFRAHPRPEVERPPANPTAAGN